MIDPIGPKTQVMTCDLSPVSFGPVAEFRAPEDLTLASVIFVGVGSQILTVDPDFTLLTVGQVSRDFQLIAYDRRAAGVTIQFSDLSYPLLKGQSLFWGVEGGAADQSIQLIFS